MAAAILELLRSHPEGLDIVQIRRLLRLSQDEPQQHLDRRLRSLDPFFEIARKRHGTRTVYVLVGKRKAGDWDFGVIKKDDRAEALMKAAGRCQMCGQTIKGDGIRLHIDHKIPREWGGETVAGNLWAICSVCNEGKKNYFATLDADTMKNVLAEPTVHRRIAGLLNHSVGKWVVCDLIEFVANFNDYQTDWRKRLRELRDVGFKIETRRRKEGRRSLSEYRLTTRTEIPEGSLRKIIRARESGRRHDRQLYER